MKKYILIIAAALSVTLVKADTELKKEIEIDSKIDRVMVYQDRALITRKSRPFTLNQGMYDISFRDLPELINDDSVRAGIQDGGNVRILDVEVRTYQLEKSPEQKVRDLKESLEKMTDEKKSVENRLAVLKLDKEYLANVKESFLNIRKSAESEDKVIQHRERTVHGIKEYDEMSRYMNEKLRKNFIDVQGEEINLRTIKSRISFISGELKKLNVSHTAIPKKKLIKVTIEVLREGSYVMEITYMNHRVKWEPGYDIRVNYGEMKTEFIGHGIVSQNSGEDWINTKISYSTAQPSMQGWLPEIVPLYATLTSNLPRQQSNKQKKISSQQEMNRSMLDNRMNEQKEKDKDKDRGGEDTGEGLVTETTASARSSAQVGSLVFDVVKRSNIMSDDSPHRTTISRQTFPVKFEYISIPKITPHAYLQAVGKNSMTSPILKGNLNIFMGNDFVGSSRTDNILPEEDFELTLSVNENIRVKRTLDEKEIKKPGFLSNNRRTTYTFLIKIENYTGSDIIINILDQIPISNSEEVEIESPVFSHEPVKKGKNGIVKWRFNMKPKETVNLSFSFTVSVPKDKEPAFFMTNMSPSIYLQNISNTESDVKLYDFDMKKKGPAMRQKLY